MRSTVALLCVAVAIAFAAQTTGTEAGRGALWNVVQTCVANHALTGAAFPCLEVNVSRGVERGYVILRPPLGDPDFILAPTRKIVGVEDPSLQTSESPNYSRTRGTPAVFYRMPTEGRSRITTSLSP